MYLHIGVYEAGQGTTLLWTIIAFLLTQSCFVSCNVTVEISASGIIGQEGIIRCSGEVGANDNVYSISVETPPTKDVYVWTIPTNTSLSNLPSTFGFEVREENPSPNNYTLILKKRVICEDEKEYYVCSIVIASLPDQKFSDQKNFEVKVPPGRPYIVEIGPPSVADKNIVTQRTWIEVRAHAVLGKRNSGNLVWRVYTAEKMEEIIFDGKRIRDGMYVDHACIEGRMSTVRYAASKENKYFQIAAFVINEDYFPEAPYTCEDKERDLCDITEMIVFHDGSKTLDILDIVFMFATPVAVVIVLFAVLCIVSKTYRREAKRRGSRERGTPTDDTNYTGSTEESTSYTDYDESFISASRRTETGLS